MFRIPKHESGVVWRLFAYSLVISFSYVVARTVGDSLFLSRLGNEQLPLVFVLGGCFTVAAAAGWFLLTRHLSVPQCIIVTSLCFAFLSVMAWVLLPTYHHSFWLLAAVYLLAEIKGCINAINIVSALNIKLGRDASKSSWTVVGVAVPVAAVVAGSILTLQHDILSLRNWLLVGAALDLVAVGLGVLLLKTNSVKFSNQLPELSGNVQRPGNAQVPQTTLSEFEAKALKHRYVSPRKFQTWLAILIFAKVIVLTIVSFEWKTNVNTYFAGDPDTLLRFFGTFYSVVGLLTIMVQLLLTNVLLSRRNFTVPLFLMPLVLIGVMLSITLGVGLVLLVAATLGKSLDIWRRSVHDTTLNLLYTRVKRENRRDLISLNSGFVKPAAEILAASVIFFGASAFYRPLVWIALGAWLIAAFRIIRLIDLRAIRKRRRKSSLLDGITDLSKNCSVLNPLNLSDN